MGREGRAPPERAVPAVGCLRLTCALSLQALEARTQRSTGPEAGCSALWPPTGSFHNPLPLATAAGAATFLVCFSFSRHGFSVQPWSLVLQLRKGSHTAVQESNLPNPNTYVREKRPMANTNGTFLKSGVFFPSISSVCVWVCARARRCAGKLLTLAHEGPKD